MLFWALSFFLFILGFLKLLSDLPDLITSVQSGKKIRSLKEVSLRLSRMQSLIETGFVPSPQQWLHVAELDPPWGKLADECLGDLRASGGAVLPTLRRIRALADESLELYSSARARASQALLQAAVCAGLCPLFSLFLYGFLPSLGFHAGLWISVTGLGSISSWIGVLWLLEMAESARWAALPRNLRSGILVAQCVVEKFLARLRGGLPADLSWSQSMEALASEFPEFTLLWGISVWNASPPASGKGALLRDFGDSIKKSIQLALLEGSPCAERVENLVGAFRSELRARMDRELATLPSRALKPLFVFVAPPLFLLLGLALYLEFLSSQGGFG